MAAGSACAASASRVALFASATGLISRALLTRLEDSPIAATQVATALGAATLNAPPSVRMLSSSQMHG